MAREQSQDEKFRRWIAQGGMRQARRVAAAEVYSVSGPDRERESAAGGKTVVGYLLSPKAVLTDRQRITGKCYGDSCERRAAGGGAEFLAVKVDGGGTPGGYNERHAAAIQFADVADAALSALPPVAYQLGAYFGKDRRGSHQPIPAQKLAWNICALGVSLEHVALTHEWWVERRDAKGRLKVVVPTRQRETVANGLRDCLDAIDAAWQAKRIAPGFEFGGVETE